MRRRVAHVKLGHGTLTVSHERRDVGAEPRLTIDTPHGTITSAFDCLFRVETNGTGTRLICETGYVYFQPNNATESTQIEPGFVGESTTAGFHIIAATDDAAAQRALVEIDDVEDRLTQLLAAQSEAPPPWIAN